MIEKIPATWINETDIPIGNFQSEIKNAEWVVLGVPFDETASFRQGCGNAPASIRQFAINLEPVNPFNEKDIAEVFVHDFGDLEFSGREEMFHRIQSILRLTSHAKPMLLGGEHTITASVADRFKNHLFLMFDAHADLRDKYDENVWSHACVARRLVEKIGGENLIQFGLRAVTKQERRFAKESEIMQIFAHDWTRNKEEKLLQEIQERLPSYEGIYLTLDMDGFDPAFVPGVGNPEPLGLTTRELFSFVSKLPRVDGADITELNPKYDNTGCSQAVAARLALVVLSGF